MSKRKININYYEVFGIPPTATSEDISAAHKALAKMYHPDINSNQDAHEKMTMLNVANEVLSDTTKREKYDNELKQHHQQEQHPGKPSSQADEAKRSHTAPDVQERNAQDRSAQERCVHERMERAELLRKKTEERLKKVEAAQQMRMEHAQKKAEEAALKSRQLKVDIDRQDVINELSELVMKDTKKRKKNMEVDEERYYATKVLLSMVRKDDNRLRRMTEEAERKQRIDDILTFVKEINEKKEWV
jgi:DnaJ-class molecular chaperone